MNKSDSGERDACEQDARTWTNGFTLKKLKEGYNWTISVAPVDQTIEALEASIDEAVRLDQKLQKIYGLNVVAKLR